MADPVDYLVLRSGALNIALPVDAVARLANEDTADVTDMAGRKGLLVEGVFVPGLMVEGQNRTINASDPSTWLLLKAPGGGFLGALFVDSVVGIEKAEDVSLWRDRLSALSAGALTGGFLAGGTICVIPDLERLTPFIHDILPSQAIARPLTQTADDVPGKAVR